MNTTCKPIPKRYNLVNNVSLHILILFVILSSLFLIVISKIESNTINKEVINLINKLDFKSMGLDSKFISTWISGLIKNQNANEHSVVNSITTDCHTPGDAFPCNKDGSDPLDSFQFKYGTIDIEKRAGINSLQPNVNRILDSVNDPKNKTINNFVKGKVNPEGYILNKKYFDFFINQFNGSKNQMTQEINRKVVEEICIAIGFLIVIAIILNVVPIKFFGYCNNTLLGIVGELVVVFMIVGVIEVMFFMNVALKYVPTKVSLIYETIRDKLTQIIKGQ